MEAKLRALAVLVRLARRRMAQADAEKDDVDEILEEVQAVVDALVYMSVAGDDGGRTHTHKGPMPRERVCVGGGGDGDGD